MKRKKTIFFYIKNIILIFLRNCYFFMQSFYNYFGKFNLHFIIICFDIFIMIIFIINMF